jgi:hypothetical protein
MTEKTKKGLFYAGIPLLTFVITAAGFYFSLDGVYQRKAEAAAEKQQTIQTFQMMQHQIDTSVKEMARNNQIADLNRQLNYLTEYRYKLKTYLRDHEEQETRNELKEVEEKLRTTKEKLNKILIGN